MGDGPRVGLLFGGSSVEHEVSVTSARGVAEALRETELAYVPVGVAADGRWLSPERSREVLDGGAARAEPPAEGDDGVRVVVDPGAGHLVAVEPQGRSRPIEIDVIFPLVHGWGGEDGRVQGALDLAGIPYVGAGVLGSAAAMDKEVAHRLCDAQGLTGVRWMAVYRRPGGASSPPPAEIALELGFPLFVKPANGGSSVGVSRVDAAAGLPAALDKAFACDRKVVVEQGIDAREIECAVLGNERPEASVLGEIVPSREFYDYAAKYLDGTSELRIPVDLDPETQRMIRATAISAFGCLGISGLARVDFLVDRRDGQVYLNEINTLPGFTPISMFPKLWEATGLPFPRLVERLVELALERDQAERNRRSLWKEGD